MKKIHRILALFLTVLMLVSVLTSCDFVENLIGDSTGSTQDPPDPDPDPDKDPEDKPGDDNKPQPEHTHVFVNGECQCGEADPNYVEPHRHFYVSGVCECGAINPNYVPPYYCESVCEKCGNCLDAECTEPSCLNKCEGHVDPNVERYGYLPIISEKMPAIYINTEDGSNEWATKYTRADKLAGRIDYVDATVTITECEEEYELTDMVAEVKVRGNYTLDYVKKPIRIKFDKKQSVLGLHDGEKYKNWVLLADWKDLSMTNNTVAFYLGNTILGSDGYYCTDFRNVEVYLNGQYWGVYLLVEQQETKDDRSSAPEVDDDYTGNDIGYLFEYDGYYNLEGPDGDPTFTINHQGLPSGGGGYTVKSDIYADSQLQFLKNYVENCLYIANQATKGKFYQFDADYNVIPATSEISVKDAVGSVIDLQSLVDTYIINEIAKDLDVDWSSFYLSLDMTGEGSKKLTFEAPWDFDSSFGLTHKDNCAPTEGLYAATNANPWFQLVANQSWFWEMVCEKWAELKKYGVFDNVITLLEAEKTTYKEYYIRNYERWSVRVTGGNTECVAELNSFKDINTAQGLAVDYHIKWIKARIAWIDSYLSSLSFDGSDSGVESGYIIPEDAVAY